MNTLVNKWLPLRNVLIFGICILKLFILSEIKWIRYISSRLILLPDKKVNFLGICWIFGRKFTFMMPRFFLGNCLNEFCGKFWIWNSWIFLVCLKFDSSLVELEKITRPFPAILVFSAFGARASFRPDIKAHNNTIVSSGVTKSRHFKE